VCDHLFDEISIIPEETPQTPSIKMNREIPYERETITKSF